MSDPAPAPAATVPQEEPIPYIDYPLIPVSESDSSDNDDFGGNLRAPPADASLIFGWPGSKSYRPNNRGNKLKRRALEPENALPRPRPALWANRVDESMQYMTLDTKRRAIVSRSSRYTDHKQADDDPYLGINVEEIWSMPDRIEDIRRHPSTVRTLRSRQLRIMADELMSLIEEQKETSRQITRLTDVLQMDDPAYQDVDLEKDGIPAGTIKETLEAAQDYLNCLNEYINQIDAIRRGIVTQYDKKRNLAAKLVPFGPQPPSSQGRKPMR